MKEEKKKVKKKKTVKRRKVRPLNEAFQWATKSIRGVSQGWKRAPETLWKDY